MPEVFAPDATFSSPVTDYKGRANVAHLMGLIAGVLDELEQTGGWADQLETVAAFTARARGDQLEGVLRERRDGSGRLVHVTLLLRPYRALSKAIERMGQLLAEQPLPEAR
jgi:hypothetical protein